MVIDALIDSFRKFLLHEKYDFDCIFVSTEEAVRHAITQMEYPEFIHAVASEKSFKIFTNEVAFNVNETKQDAQITNEQTRI